LSGTTYGDLDGSGPGQFKGGSDAFVVGYDVSGNRLWVKQEGTTAN